MASDDIKKQSKKKVKPDKIVKCLYCDENVELDSNKFLCKTHLLDHSNDLKCNAITSSKTQCKYNATYNGFCGHHITVPSLEEHVERTFNTSRKILLKPTNEQKNLLRKWFGVSRLCYNTAVSNLNNKTSNFSNVRDIVTKKLDHIDYCKIVPLKIKQESVNDAIKAVSNAILKYTKVKKFQKVKYKYKMAPSHSININKEAIRKLDDKTLCIYPRTLGSIKCSEKIPDLLTHCRITVKYNRYFYICIPMELELNKNEPVFKNNVVALDPGERTFNSFYSNNCVGNIGMDARSRFYKIFDNSDLLVSKQKKLKNKKKKTRGKIRRKLQNKIKHLRKKYLTLISKPTRLAKELHSKTALFLCKNFDTILIPDYSCKKLSNNLNSIVNRSNQALSHYAFRIRLFHTAKRFNRKVHLVKESYTSMTCTSCGDLNNKDSSPILTCSNCKTIMNRDLRGSRNIWLKNIVSIQELL